MKITKRFPWSLRFAAMAAEMERELPESAKLLRPRLEERMTRRQELHDHGRVLVLRADGTIAGTRVPRSTVHSLT